MKKYRDIVIDNSGNSIKSATITVTDNPSDSISTIYSDDGITAKANPFTSSAIDGVYEFYAANGRYNVIITKTGYGTETISDIVLEDNLNPILSGETGVVNIEYPYGYIKRHGTNTTPGTTDMTTALNNLFTSCTSTGYTARLDRENFLTSSKVTCNCNVEGEGATITGYIETAANNLTMRNFNIVSLQDIYGLYLHGQVGTRYNNILLEKIKITFDAGVAVSTRLGLHATYIDDLTMRDCHIQYGVQFVSVKEYLVTGNLLDGDNFQNINELLHCSIKSTGIISNNTFIDASDNWIDLFSSGERTVVTGNRFLGCSTRLGTAVEIKVSLTDDANGSDATNGFIEQIIITDNLFYNVSCPSAQSTTCLNIYYIDNRAAPSFDWADTPTNLIISNNIFDGFDDTNIGSSFFNSIKLDQVNSAIISNNVINGINLTGASTISSGIWMDNCRDIMFSNNRISSEGGSGITVHGTCQDVSIVDNNFGRDLKNGFQLGYGVRFIDEGSDPVYAATKFKISGNVFDCSVESFYAIDSHGELSDSVISNNVCYEESYFGNANRCIFTGNVFEVGTTKTAALLVGTTTQICEHNIITNNRFKADSGTPKYGLNINRVRSSIITGNISDTCTRGIQVTGTSSAGELDDLTIKDNYSVSQTFATFPQYSSMHATDTGTLVVANNQKTT